MLDALFVSRDPSVAAAMSMIEGHFRFLRNNTGTTHDAKIQHFVQNEDGVLSNNRHFIAATQMEYHPNGDATTEGQALHVIGHCYAYLATRDSRYLDAAKVHWEAYVAYFYAGQPVPESPRRWVANWVVNGKEPVLANWPINTEAPTHGGYKSVPLQFVDGAAQIPQGSPFWGEYLDVATFAHRGHMAWEAINGDVKVIDEAIDWAAAYAQHRVSVMPASPASALAWIDWPAYLGKPGYGVDWSNDAPTYPVEWIVAWTRDKIDQDGEVIASGLSTAEVGKIQLQDTSINGVYLFNYAVRLPVEHGGYRVARNEAWHNRPLCTPLLGPVEQFGNAADGEEWFADACYLLWRITGDITYHRALASVLYTLGEYAQIDSEDMFYRRAKGATTPFTDGTAYAYTYPSGLRVDYSRDDDGFIVAALGESAQMFLEQNAVTFRVRHDSRCVVEFGGVDAASNSVSARVALEVAPSLDSTEREQWVAALPPSLSSSPILHEIALSTFTQAVTPEGEIYLVADSRAVTDYGDISWSIGYEENIADGRVSTVIDAVFADDSGGLIIGHWLTAAGVAPMTSITYRAEYPMNLRITDAQGWRWYWLLPATAGAWSTFSTTLETAILSGYQPDHPDDPEPSTPSFTTVDQVTILLDAADTNAHFSYYCINELPPRFLADDAFVTTFSLRLSAADAFTARVGDCTIRGQLPGALAYTPGLIPFANSYQIGGGQFAAWRGMPYPGYQYPAIYCLDGLDMSKMTQMVDFLYDAQQWYFARFGQLGPVASAYIWNRWDNLAYGERDTFTMHHWGDGPAWSGYQSRALLGACRAWQELSDKGAPVPDKLVTFCENWINWLVSFTTAHNGALPYDFPADALPNGNQDDFTGHMTGAWLASACLAHMAGCRSPGIERLIETCVTALQSNYAMTGIPGHAMNGAWSPALRLGSDNGMFYGFWSGEILRGLALYVLYKTGHGGGDIFADLS